MDTHRNMRQHRGIRRRHAVLFLALMLSTVALALPAAAAPPGGPTEVAEPGAQPRLDTEPDCKPDPDGFHYEMVHPNAPQDAVYVGQWREAPNGDIHNLPFNQAAGFVASGNGDFQVRGVILNQGQPFHEYDWVDVTVSCVVVVPPGAQDPAVTIDLEVVCDIVEGFAYEVTIAPEPEGNLGYRAHWSEPGHQWTSEHGQSGVVATGEGTFDVRGVVHELDIVGGSHYSDTQEITVDCSGPEDTDPDDGTGDDDDAPRPGNPNFTG